MPIGMDAGNVSAEKVTKESQVVIPASFPGAETYRWGKLDNTSLVGNNVCR